MKILPVITPPEAQGYKSRYEMHLEKKEQQDEEEPAYILSEFLDDKAQEYSDDDVSFGEQYKNLEKIYENFAQKITVLQEQINKLNQNPIQRHLQLKSSQAQFTDVQVSSLEQSLTVEVEHIGAKKYKNSQQQAQIDLLVKQLGEMQTEQAAIKRQMIEMIVTEMKKRDND
ncbi:hypothetical protein [Pseudoalteromonas sp. Ld20]|uniref:hypothetical protein n=1 Tax=Pseudoalteromonas sp. Ld20 TaxID=649165 RepID=UPI003863A663